jgi:hypothetical protein
MGVHAQGSGQGAAAHRNYNVALADKYANLLVKEFLYVRLDSADVSWFLVLAFSQKIGKIIHTLQCTLSDTDFPSRDGYITT